MLAGKISHHKMNPIEKQTYPWVADFTNDQRFCVVHLATPNTRYVHHITNDGEYIIIHPSARRSHLFTKSQIRRKTPGKNLTVMERNAIRQIICRRQSHFETQSKICAVLNGNFNQNQKIEVIEILDDEIPVIEVEEMNIPVLNRKALSKIAHIDSPLLYLLELCKVAFCD